MQKLRDNTDIKMRKPEYVTVIVDTGVFGLASFGCRIRMHKDEVYKTILNGIPDDAQIGLYECTEKAFGYLSDRFRVSYKNEVKKCK